MARSMRDSVIISEEGSSIGNINDSLSKTPFFKSDGCCETRLVIVCIPMQVPHMGTWTPRLFASSVRFNNCNDAFMYWEVRSITSVSPPVKSTPLTELKSSSNTIGDESYSNGTTRPPALSIHFTYKL